MVKWGIIASGGIARRRTLPAMKYVENARIIAIMDKDKNVLKEISEEYDIPYVYDDEDELLSNPEVDAVYVASPVCFHKEQALKVLRAGKHLLLEKPLGLDQKDCEELVEEAAKTDCKAGVAMVMRHHPAHRRMKEIISDNKIGNIVSCRAQLNCWFPDMKGNWRQNKKIAGGGALVDMGTHCFDLLRYLLEDEAEWVFGDISTKTFSYEVDDSADCLLHTKKGATCFVDVHFNVPDEAAKGMLEIYGTKGSLIAQGTIGQDGKGKVYMNFSEEDSGYQSQQIRKNDELGKELIYEWEDIYAAQIREFSEAISGGKTVKTSIKDAFENVKITDALYKSAKEKCAVYLK